MEIGSLYEFKVQFVKCDYLVQVIDSFCYSGFFWDDYLQFLIVGCDENDLIVLVVYEVYEIVKILRLWKDYIV